MTPESSSIDGSDTPIPYIYEPSSSDSSDNSESDDSSSSDSDRLSDTSW